ncbi:hypothetical protein [Candidatus Avelusimicrobium faecicola]|uniref:hypothetical protein n=1 Tax=Candidatus Avelusimicrobium faecicola TaxID=3416205 RepID=UPI003D1301B9
MEYWIGLFVMILIAAAVYGLSPKKIRKRVLWSEISFLVIFMAVQVIFYQYRIWRMLEVFR